MIIRNKTPFSLLFSWHGTILPRVLMPILFLSAASVLLGMVAHYKWFDIPTPPLVGFTVFGVILSISLGFRNNASYERWWEGRKLWGVLIAAQRHLVRESGVLDDDTRSRLLRRVILFARLLRDRLRQETAAHEDLSQYGTLDAQSLIRHINPPQFVLETMQRDLIRALREGQIDSIVYTSLSAHLAELGNVQAGCDRIAGTPLPFSYSVLLHRAIYGFCFMLPFGIENILGVWTPVMVAWLAYLFLGLDALGGELEEPFGTQANDLPLDAIVLLVEREILAALGQPMPDAHRADKFKLQ